MEGALRPAILLYLVAIVENLRSRASLVCCDSQFATRRLHTSEAELSVLRRIKAHGCRLKQVRREAHHFGCRSKSSQIILWVFVDADISTQSQCAAQRQALLE